jgi:hypothetical protein
MPKHRACRGSAANTLQVSLMLCTSTHFGSVSLKTTLSPYELAHRAEPYAVAAVALTVDCRLSAPLVGSYVYPAHSSDMQCSTVRSLR